jgi:hypothetical protein
MAAEPPDIGYEAKYYKANGTNITSDVEGAGLTFNVKPSKHKKFPMKIKRSQVSDDAICIVVTIDDGVSDPDFAAIAVNVDLEDCAIPI